MIIFFEKVDIAALHNTNISFVLLLSQLNMRVLAVSKHKRNEIDMNIYPYIYNFIE